MKWGSIGPLAPSLLQGWAGGNQVRSPGSPFSLCLCKLYNWMRNRGRSVRREMVPPIKERLYQKSWKLGCVGQYRKFLCMWVHVCTCVWRPEVNPKCHSLGAKNQTINLCQAISLQRCMHCLPLVLIRPWSVVGEVGSCSCLALWISSVLQIIFHNYLTWKRSIW